MALILNIDTSTHVCSVALCRNAEVLSLKENKENLQHAKLLAVFIDWVFNEHKLKPTNLDAVSISGGPGSFTGLRIGTATAKGMCYALGVPLIAISTLEALAFSVISRQEEEKNTFYCPTINLKGEEVYAALYNSFGEQIQAAGVYRISKDLFANFLPSQKIIFLGTGADKCRKILNHQPNALFLKNVFPSAAYMCILSEKYFTQKTFQDVAYFEPFYLKEFVPTIPKQKPIRLKF